MAVVIKAPSLNQTPGSSFRHSVGVDRPIDDRDLDGLTRPVVGDRDAAQPLPYFYSCWSGRRHRRV